MDYPRVYLAIDNCFASKRWTKPGEWMEVIKELGVNYVEASADNECDPLYTTEEYLKDWIDEIKRTSEKTGVRVANLYSGHGTYATLGLAHTDFRIRERFLAQWLKPMAKVASQLDAGLGFFCHAFPESILQSSTEYDTAKKDLYGNLAELAAYVCELGTGYTGVEQMYTPHQIPWTIDGALELLRHIYNLKGNPLYITIDTGHQTGQRKFLRSDYGKIKELLCACRNDGRVPGLWLGSRAAYELFSGALGKSGADEDAEIEKILEDQKKHPYLFADYSDGNTYNWLERFGCYSPIIHLQQTDGKSSSHRPFTKECNQNGIITGEKLLQAIYNSYHTKNEDGLPPKCEKIYLTLEIFSGTAEMNADILWRMGESVKYWRRFIPEDGIRLNELMLSHRLLY